MSKIFEIFGRGLETRLTDILWHWVLAVKETVGSDRKALIEIPLNRLCDMRLDDAEKALKTYLYEFPDCQVARMLAVSVCLHRGLMQQALENLQSVYMRSPGNTMALYAMGYCYEMISNDAQAAEFYQDCLKFKHYLELPRQRLAAIYLKRGHIGRAIEEYCRLKKENPDDIRSAALLGHLHLANMEYSAAIDDFNTAILMHPDNFHEHIIDDDDFVSAEQISGPYDLIEKLNRMIQTMPEKAELYTRLGDAYLDAGEHNQAGSSYEQALRIQPNYLEACIKLGSLYKMTGKPAIAAQQFTVAAEINDDIIDAYAGLLTAQMLAGQKVQYENTLQLATSLLQNSAILYTEIARLQFIASPRQFAVQSGRQTKQSPDKAVRTSLYESLKNRPNDPRLNYVAAMFLMYQGNLAGASNALKHVLEINPAYHRAATRQAMILYQLDRKNDISKILADSIKFSPQSLSLHYHTALLYTDNRRFAGAMRSVYQMLGKSVDAEQLCTTVSQTLENIGLVDRAATSYQTMQQLADSAIESLG